MAPTTTVIGCGLIGGSILKGLRAAAPKTRLAAVDLAPVLQRVGNHVDESAELESDAARALVARSELIVLASPVRAIIGHLPWVLATMPAGAVVTDTGSSKRAVLEAVASSPARRRFVAGHPMAGREVGGFDASDARLFVAARWFVVSEGLPLADAPHADALARVEELARTLGAEPQPCDAQSHDRAMAYVSHVPQLISSAVYGAAARAGMLDRAGPGFRDVTRIAGGPAAMWRDVFDTNRTFIAEALGALLGPLTAVLRELERGDDAAIDRAVLLLEEAQATKARAPVPATPHGPVR